jgi:hypothetical protein
MPTGPGTYGRKRGRPPTKGLRKVTGPRRPSTTGLRGPRKRKPKLK